LVSRLLLVEDNLMAAEAVRSALVDHGFSVQVINVGRQAIGSLIQRPADVVVIDLTRRCLPTLKREPCRSVLL
jgi:DNA-binding response OmpR family regulator